MKKPDIKFIERDSSKEDFKVWIKIAEKSPKMSLEKFNEKWKEKELEIKNILGNSI